MTRRLAEIGAVVGMVPNPLEGRIEALEDRVASIEKALSDAEAKSKFASEAIGAAWKVYETVMEPKMSQNMGDETE